MAALSIASRHQVARARVLSRQPSSADLCGGTVIIHSDLAVTCTEATCTADNDERWVLANRHLWFISCVDALRPLCPRCAAQTPGTGRSTGKLKRAGTGWRPRGPSEPRAAIRYRLGGCRSRTPSRHLPALPEAGPRGGGPGAGSAKRTASRAGVGGVLQGACRHSDERIAEERTDALGVISRARPTLPGGVTSHRWPGRAGQ